jgi:membrane-associated protease RseP (regulator of RpoE activity)
MIWSIPIFLLLIVLLHEVGHVISAKIQGLIVEKFSFSLKPVPRFYVTIIENKITMRQRLLFLLGGNFMVLFLFAIFLITGINNKILYYVFVYQIVLDTNPFYSDYVIAIMSYVFRKDYKKIYLHSKYGQKNQDELTENDLKELYMFSPVWYIHFVLWGMLIILLASSKFLSSFVN